MTMHRWMHIHNLQWGKAFHWMPPAHEKLGTSTGTSAEDSGLGLAKCALWWVESLASAQFGQPRTPPLGLKIEIATFWTMTQRKDCKSEDIKWGWASSRTFRSWMWRFPVAMLLEAHWDCFNYSPHILWSLQPCMPEPSLLHILKAAIVRILWTGLAAHSAKLALSQCDQCPTFSVVLNQDREHIDCFCNQDL